MNTPASFAKHPLHPILITLPIGLFIFSLFSDLMSRLQWDSPTWQSVALYTLAGGIVTAIIAAIPGVIDVLSLKDAKLKKIGIVHMATNLIAVGVFVVSLFLRLEKQNAGSLPAILSAVGVIMIGFGGWLGGELVHRFGVSVDERQILDRHAH